MELRTLEQAERYLDGFINRERTGSFDYARLGTRRVEALLEAVGGPQVGLPCLHVAGSKGKGSVSLLAERLLLAVGMRVGTFTSPHLESWRERFRIDGREATPEEMLAGLRVLYPAAERLRKDPELRPSFFDVTTVLGLLLFRRAGVDGAVVEVGLGGRLDSTNAVEARVSVITSIELEHAAMLGGTLAAIAGEKAGILRTGVPVVHGPLPAEALSVILARAIATDCEVEDVEARAVELRTDGVRFVLPDGRRIVAGVLGRHQATNSALAVRATERWLGRSLTGDEIGALEGVRLPARLERIGDAVLDSAHTPESARALRETLRALYPERRWVAVVSIATDKDAAALLRQLAPATHAIVLCRAEPVRSRDPEALVEEARACGIGRVEVVEEPRAALERARAHLLPGDLLVVTGSFYLAGALRTPLRGG